MVEKIALPGQSLESKSPTWCFVNFARRFHIISFFFGVNEDFYVMVLWSKSLQYCAF